MNNSGNTTDHNLWDGAKAEIMTLDENTKESKTEIQLCKYPFPFQYKKRTALKKEKKRKET